MTFSQQLNQYMEQLRCSAKELAEASGLSSAVISRYRNGERVPAADSRQVRQLAEGISMLAQQKQESGLSETTVFSAFQKILTAALVREEQLAAGFDQLVSTLSIRMAELARSLNYDPSYLSRIRSGERSPSNPSVFCEEVARFAALRFFPEQRALLAQMIGCEPGELEDQASCLSKLSQWLMNGSGGRTDQVQSFLEKLSSFDLDDYIRAIHFDELKVPTAPFQIPVSRSYSGIREFMESELDFLKAAVWSRSREPVIMYSDMPMEEMSKDPEFPKKWMFGMAMMLKKGLHLNMIHNVDRPFYEMMLGLESYIPMYMTGQISPYYLTASQNSVFCHFLKVSGTAALSGECIAGAHKDGKYYLTKKKEEVAYYRKRALALLRHAKPLMKIYRADTAGEFRSFCKREGAAQVRRGILSSPPLYTLTDECLEQILDENGVSEAVRKKIRSHVAESRREMEIFLHESVLHDEIGQISEEEFAAHPTKLFLADLFLEEEIAYSYRTYQEHLQLTRAYAECHEHYSIQMTASSAFRNIQIRINEGKWVIVSKINSPAVHFVIHHPKLRRAIENIVIPLADIQ